MKTRSITAPPRIEILEPRIVPAAVASISLAALDGAVGFKLSGVADSDYAGRSVSDAGDINGDGFADLLIGARYADEGGSDRGAAYVVFGKAGRFGASVALAGLNGRNGFKLSGAGDFDMAGGSVSAAGDVNGDGFGDLLVGAERADGRGAAYVVFGKAGGFSANVALSALNGSNGFKLSAADYFDDVGSVSAAGDVNGDGFADLIIGDQFADGRGAAYVVFGKAGGFGASVALSGLDGSNGFKLSGVADDDFAGGSVSAAGDVNGDGFGDLVIGAFRADEGGIARGAAYVIFGKAGGFDANVALSGLDGSNGFKLRGVADFDTAGFSVSAAGDVNGDGFGDLIIGATAADEGGDNRGAAYVVFGKAGGFGASVALSGLNGSNGFRLSGVADIDLAGGSVSAAGDVNGDGFGDLIIGATAADEGGDNRGAAYVVFGKAGGFGPSVALSGLDGSNGFKLSGVANDDLAGRSVSAAGDVNGDGFGDLLVGTYRGDGGGANRGEAYVVFGFGTGEVTVSTDGKSASFADWDGDHVVIKSTKGPLLASQFKLSSPNPLTGGAHLIYADFTAATTGGRFTGAALTFIATRSFIGGDGLVNVGTLDARGVVLGKVNVDGDLQQLDAAGAAGLTVFSLGQFAAADVHGGPLTSVIDARLGALNVKTDASRVTLVAQTFGPIKAGRLDNVTLAAETFRAIHALSLDGASILATGVVDPAKVANALAIKSLTVRGSVRDSQILAGYDATGAAVNADVQIGAVRVLGQWIASDIAAGVRAGADGIFATGDDALIAGGNSIVAKIAGITITGAAFGTVENLRDGFGFAAEEIAGFKIGKTRIPLLEGGRNDIPAILVGLTGDVRVREVFI